jgi:hypothetical protein
MQAIEMRVLQPTQQHGSSAQSRYRMKCNKRIRIDFKIYLLMRVRKSTHIQMHSHSLAGTNGCVTDTKLRSRQNKAQSHSNKLWITSKRKRKRKFRVARTESKTSNPKCKRKFIVAETEFEKFKPVRTDALCKHTQLRTGTNSKRSTRNAELSSKPISLNCQPRSHRT